jgi:hypothetical protein
MGNEDFTTYTEVDPNSRVDVSSEKIDFTDIQRNETAYRASDKGAAYFSDDFTHQFEALVSTVATTNGIAFVWGLANQLNDLRNINVAAGDKDNQAIYLINASVKRFNLRVGENGTASDDPSTPLSANTLYFLTIIRDDDGGVNGTGQLICYIRTGSHTGTLVDTLTVDCSAGEQNDFRYLYGFSSHNNGTTSAISGFAQNLDLGLASPNNDASYSESVVRHKYQHVKDGMFRVHKVSLVCDSGDGSLNITTDLPVYGKLRQIVVKPGSVAPTDQYDITVNESEFGTDLFGSLLHDLSSSNAELFFPTDDAGLIIEHGVWMGNAALNIVVSNNSVNSAEIDIYFYIEQ